jgi:PIN domain nuclease of toxin-antitoxin system
MSSTLLLDTHVLLWWLVSPGKLSRRVFRLLERSPAAVSVLSIFELRLKQESRGLVLPPGNLADLIVAQDFRLLPLTVEHVEAAASLGGLHADPYDRLLLGTARSERMRFVTRDAQLLELAAPLLGELLLEA